jgi:hypothetical protein
MKLTNNIVQPIILGTPGLKDNTQMQVTIRRLRASSLEEDVGTIISTEVIPSISGKDIGLGINEAPISSYVENLAYKELSRINPPLISMI